MPDMIGINLLSDTTFSRGDGTAGEVDVEVVHDDMGMPYVPARTLKGLLLDSWLAMAHVFRDDALAAEEVFGVAGDMGATGRMRLDDGCLPREVRAVIEHATRRKDNPVAPGDILRAFTGIRRRTARDRKTGGPREATLRAIRVVIRDAPAAASVISSRPTFLAPIAIADSGFTDDHWRVLARACLGMRHAGLGRNRGAGHVRLSIQREVQGKLTDKTAHFAALGD